MKYAMKEVQTRLVKEMFLRKCTRTVKEHSEERMTKWSGQRIWQEMRLKKSMERNTFEGMFNIPPKEKYLS